jgi:transketolase
MPCAEVFNDQTQAYKESVFPDGAVSVSIEAMSTMGWQRFTHAQVGLDTFGASGPYKDVYKHFGLTPEVLADKAKKALAFYGPNVISPVRKPF